MAKLTTRQRKALPASKFAGPDRSFPIPDKSHAIAAKRLVGRSEKAGNITPAQGAAIKAKAENMLNAEGNRASLHFANMKRMGK